MPREEDEGTKFDSDLHNMGGDIGPGSIRGANRAPRGKPDDTAEPASGYAEPMGYVTGRDDEWGVTAGSGEKSVAARTDEVPDHLETAGPSPHPMPPDAIEEQGHGGRPGFRVQGPVDETEHGVVEDETPRGAMPYRVGEGGHVSGDLEWAEPGEDDPDVGSGRTDADDGGYLPGEGTGRPY